VGRRISGKCQIDGANPVQLTTKYWSAGQSVSPDGKSIVYVQAQVGIGSRYKIVIIPFEGGEPLRIIDLPVGAVAGLQWTADGRALAYGVNKGGITNIWRQPLDGGAPKQLTDFRSGKIFSYDWSRDGKQLALARGSDTSDVVMISDFR